MTGRICKIFTADIHGNENARMISGYHNFFGFNTVNKKAG